MMGVYGDGYMFGGHESGFALLGTATWLVWLTVGVLLAVFLWKKINNK